MPLNKPKRGRRRQEIEGRGLKQTPNREWAGGNPQACLTVVQWGGLGCPLQALFPELIRPEVDEVGEGEAG